MTIYKKDPSQELIEQENCCEDPCIDVREGNKVCLNCGLVFGINLVGEERRAYSKEEVENRRCNEPRWRDFGPRTILQSSVSDSKGSTLNASQRTLFSRLSKIQNSLISSIERNFWEAKPRMKQYVSKLSLPAYIHDTSWKIYTIAAKKKLTMGRSIDGFIAAALYVSIRVHEFPILLEDISDAGLVPRRTIIRSVGFLIKEVLPELGLNYKPITIEQLIIKFGNELALPMKTQKYALKIIKISSKKGLARIGKDPKGLAASAIYLATKATNQRKTQAEITKVAKITEVTLRTRVRDIKYKLSNK